MLLFPDVVESLGGVLETGNQLGDDVCDRTDFVHPADDLADRHRTVSGLSDSFIR